MLDASPLLNSASYPFVNVQPSIIAERDHLVGVGLHAPAERLWSSELERHAEVPRVAEEGPAEHDRVATESLQVARDGLGRRVRDG
jgi:hypothetical protein